MDRVEQVRARFELLSPLMDERMTRLWAAAEAKALGRGGSAVVTAATGIRGKRIWMGKAELEKLQQSPSPADKPREQRVRRPGGGRKRLTEKDPTLKQDLDRLVEPSTRGDPESALRWTTKSKANLAEELKALGHQVSATIVGELLHEMGYSLQALAKEKEGSQSPDRNAQFEHINAEVKAFQKRGQPTVSVDTKKKELVGDFKNGGQEWQPKNTPERVRVHDFKDPVLGKAIPYGIYDPARNEGWVNVGVDHDTAEFAVNSLLAWWTHMGKDAYSGATELLVTADGGGSNGSRSHLWKAQLQEFADKTGLTVSVCHFPPGTSKWNKIEHRLFSQITQNWRGRPLVSHETIVNLIGSTTTKTGLRVRSKLDPRSYQTGKKVPKAVMRELNIHKNDFHGEWNYTLQPKDEQARS